MSKTYLIVEKNLRENPIMGPWGGVMQQPLMKVHMCIRSLSQYHQFRNNLPFKCLVSPNFKWSIKR